MQPFILLAIGAAFGYFLLPRLVQKVRDWLAGEISGE